MMVDHPRRVRREHGASIDCGCRATLVEGALCVVPCCVTHRVQLEPEARRNAERLGVPLRMTAR